MMRFRVLATALVLGAAGLSLQAALAGPLRPLAGAQKVQQPPQCHGYHTYGVPRMAPLDTKRRYIATVKTSEGTLTIRLDPVHAPTAVASFVFLADHHYFDGVSFHRIVPGFVIQGGDPTGTGLCGPGYQFKDENTGGTYKTGTVAMANAGPKTNGSQFFIVLADNTALNSEPNYSIFGQVTSGLDTVRRIARVPLTMSSSGEMSKPKHRVYMKTVRISVR